MRNWTALLSGAATLVAVFVLVPDAEAQSVFQKLFGFGSQPLPAPMAMPRPRQVIPSYRFHRDDSERQSRAQHAAEEDIGPPDSGGPYRTLCVRTCDGFYFPLRHNARHKNFASDVKSCESSCGSDARLFYYSLIGPEGPDAMVDLAGRKYAELPHAFAYRKKLVQDCTCKPTPWSAEELARHQSYADKEAIELAKDVTFVKAQEAAQAQSKPENAAATEADAKDRAMPGRATAVAEAQPQPADAVHADQPRKLKAYAQRAQFRPTSTSPLPSLFGGKPKYIWPGDAQ
jgi:hypothetical protein